MALSKAKRDMQEKAKAMKLEGKEQAEAKAKVEGGAKKGKGKGEGKGKKAEKQAKPSAEPKAEPASAEPSAEATPSAEGRGKKNKEHFAKQQGKMFKDKKDKKGKGKGKERKAKPRAEPRDESSGGSGEEESLERPQRKRKRAEQEETEKRPKNAAKKERAERRMERRKTKQEELRTEGSLLTQEEKMASKRANQKTRAPSKASSVCDAKCKKDHTMLKKTENPTGYKNEACCDICGTENMPQKCEFFFHCNFCKWDVCPNCILKWRQSRIRAPKHIREAEKDEAEGGVKAAAKEQKDMLKTLNRQMSEAEFTRARREIWLPTDDIAVNRPPVNVSVVSDWVEGVPL